MRHRHPRSGRRGRPRPLAGRSPGWPASDAVARPVDINADHNPMPPRWTSANDAGPLTSTRAPHGRPTLHLESGCMSSPGGRALSPGWPSPTANSWRWWVGCGIVVKLSGPTDRQSFVRTPTGSRKHDMNVVDLRGHVALRPRRDRATPGRRDATPVPSRERRSRAGAGRPWSSRAVGWP